jgi:hypothetical protein
MKTFYWVYQMIGNDWRLMKQHFKTAKAADEFIKKQESGYFKRETVFEPEETQQD